MPLYSPKASLHVENCTQPGSSHPKRACRTRRLLERDAGGQEWFPYKEYLNRQPSRQVKSQLNKEDRGLQNHEWHNTGSVTISVQQELTAAKWRKPAENEQEEGILTQPAADPETSSNPGQRPWRLQWSPRGLQTDQTSIWNEKTPNVLKQWKVAPSSGNPKLRTGSRDAQRTSESTNRGASE